MASIDGSSGVDYYTNARSSGVDYEDEWIRQIEEFIMKHQFTAVTFLMIFSGTEILVMILTLLELCGLIKSDRSTPVFVFNLILSDLIHKICILITILIRDMSYACLYSFIVGLYFMACVAFERYLQVSPPIWYRSHSLKVCCGVSVIIWLVPLILTVTDFSSLTIPIICLIPYPIIILCFVGTCRGLSHAISLTPLKRKQILGSLFVVLLTYTFLILPFLIMIVTLVSEVNNSEAFFLFSFVLIFLNPLADCVLYMFLRPDVGGLMKSVLCCCRTDTENCQSSTHSWDEHSRDSSAEFACCVSMQKPASHSQTACSSV